VLPHITQHEAVEPLRRGEPPLRGQPRLIEHYFAEPACAEESWRKDGECIPLDDREHLVRALLDDFAIGERSERARLAVERLELNSWCSASART
jgi:hypothetical protein